jgi:leucyl-tRNA synthetase
MVLNEIYLRKIGDARISYYNPAEVEWQLDDKGQRAQALLKADGAPVESGGIGTMSKSKNNGVDPQALIETYGADTARFVMIFASPPEQTLEWSDSGVQGAYRFLKRLWAFAHEHQGKLGKSSGHNASRPIDWTQVDWTVAGPQHKEWRREIHRTLKQANYDLGKHQFNTVASACMKILNTLERAAGAAQDGQAATQAGTAHTAILVEGMSMLLRLLSPIAPHITHELWRELGYGEDILHAPWPEPDPAALEQDEIELVVQVNGKLRGNIRVARTAGKDVIEAAALASEQVQKFVAGQSVKKVVVVPGRLVNVVV